MEKEIDPRHIDESQESIKVRKKWKKVQSSWILFCFSLALHTHSPDSIDVFTHNTYIAFHFINLLWRYDGVAPKMSLQFSLLHRQLNHAAQFSTPTMNNTWGELLPCSPFMMKQFSIWLLGKQASCVLPLNTSWRPDLACLSFRVEQ